MPEFHTIFFIALVVIKILLFLSLVLSSAHKIGFSDPPNILITISVFMALFSFVVDSFVSHVYWKKWCSYSKNAPEILQSKNAQKI
jgi:hypothetical protein